MANRPKSFWIVIIIFALAIYVCVVLLGLTESTRRSLLLRDETDAADRVFISIVVTNASPSAQELTAQLGFRLAGEIAKDDVTPAVDLKLLINDVRAQQEFDFRREKRMNRIEAIFPLNGDLNKYPFDRYDTTVWLLMTTPAQDVQLQSPKLPASVPEFTHKADELAVSSTALLRNAPVALSVSLSASIPGIRFRGNVSRGNIQEPTGIALHVTRQHSVISVSLIVMCMMSVLAMSLFAMVIRWSTMAAQKTDLLPLAVSISLIFGLPALRNIQPGVPPVGAIVDYIAFIWAELMVAASAVIIVWTWLLRSRAKL
jgi:Domain of unknown function (DUF4436)